MMEQQQPKSPEFLKAIEEIEQEMAEAMRRQQEPMEPSNSTGRESLEELMTSEYEKFLETEYRMSEGVLLRCKGGTILGWIGGEWKYYNWIVKDWFTNSMPVDPDDLPDDLPDEGSDKS